MAMNQQVGPRRLAEHAPEFQDPHDVLARWGVTPWRLLDDVMEA